MQVIVIILNFHSHLQHSAAWNLHEQKYSEYQTLWKQNLSAFSYSFLWPLFHLSSSCFCFSQCFALPASYVPLLCNYVSVIFDIKVVFKKLFSLCHLALLSNVWKKAYPYLRVMLHVFACLLCFGSSLLYRERIPDLKVACFHVYHTLKKHQGGVPWCWCSVDAS